MQELQAAQSQGNQHNDSDFQIPASIAMKSTMNRKKLKSDRFEIARDNRDRRIEDHFEGSAPGLAENEINVSPGEIRIRPGRTPGLDLPGSLLGFLKALAAAGLVKKAHDGQDGAGSDDHPLCPRQRPPENGQDHDGHGQREAAEAKFHGTSLLWKQDLFILKQNKEFFTHSSFPQI
jgi:hypothetical protein